jgi:hypothetical protein
VGNEAPLSAFADLLRAKAVVRRKRDVKRAAEKTPTAMGNQEWHGVPLTCMCRSPQDSGTHAAATGRVSDREPFGQAPA